MISNVFLDKSKEKIISLDYGVYKIILIGTLYTFLYIMSCYWVTFDSYEKRLVANVLKKLSIKGMFKNDSRKK